jgi:hypothetical protein
MYRLYSGGGTRNGGFDDMHFLYYLNIGSEQVQGNDGWKRNRHFQFLRMSLVVTTSTMCLEIERSSSSRRLQRYIGRSFLSTLKPKSSAVNSLSKHRLSLRSQPL